MNPIPLCTKYPALNNPPLALRYPSWHSTLLLLILLIPLKVSGVDFLESTFLQIEGSIHKITQLIIQKEFIDAQKVARGMLSHSSALQKSTQKDIGKNNKTWNYYTTNIYHHNLELIKLLQIEDSVGAISILATITHHTGDLQATVPLWLKRLLFKHLDALQRGVINHQMDDVRNAAEFIHNSTNRLLLSIASRPDAYRHTRWADSVSKLNSLGDSIIPLSEQGEWALIDEKTREIAFLIKRWSDSLHTILKSETP